MKTPAQRLEKGFDAIKDAKILYTLLALLLSYVGVNEKERFDQRVPVTVVEHEVVVIPQAPAPAHAHKNWGPTVNKAVAAAIREHNIDHHGGS